MESYDEGLARERAERREARRVFDAKMTAVAQLLGAAYVPNGRDELSWDTGTGHITHADYSIYVNRNTHQGKKPRISISGRYPTPAGSDMATRIPRDVMTYQERAAGRQDDMTVADGKTAEQVAKDIERRILPAVLDYTARFAALDGRNSEAATERDACIEQIKTAFPGVSTWVQGQGTKRVPGVNDTVQVSVSLGDNDSVTVSVGPGGRCVFERLYVGADVAVRVIRALKRTSE